MSDRVAVMNAGRIEQLGAPQEIYDKPATEFVADFIGETNFIERLHDRGRGQAGARPSRREAETAFRGAVVATMVIGPAVQCVVRLDDGQEVLVREQRAGGGSRAARAGERVLVTWAGDEDLELDERGR